MHKSIANILIVIVVFITHINLCFSRTVIDKSVNNTDPTTAITGIWRIQDPIKKIQINIQPCSENRQTMCANITSLDLGGSHFEPYLDIHNPIPQLQSRPLLGLRILSNMTLSSDDSWDNGTLYNPENGQEYSCAFKLTTDNQGAPLLEARIYKGIHVFGETRYWTR